MQHKTQLFRPMRKYLWAYPDRQGHSKAHSWHVLWSSLTELLGQFAWNGKAYIWEKYCKCVVCWISPGSGKRRTSLRPGKHGLAFVAWNPFSSCNNFANNAKLVGNCYESIDECKYPSERERLGAQIRISVHTFCIADPLSYIVEYINTCPWARSSFCFSDRTRTRKCIQTRTKQK